jgi:hypothetical protein
MFVTALFGAWLAWTVRSAQVQHDAVAAIVRAGGSVRYDWNWADGAPNPDGRPRAPRWLADRVGPDYLGHAVSVSLMDGTDAQLIAVSRLSRLEDLGIGSSPRITDAGVAQLEALSNLEFPALAGTAVTDAGLTHLERLHRLRRLSLIDTPITDLGLLHLKKLRCLEVLCLDMTDVSDAGLVHIKEIASLHSVFLLETKVTDSGAQRLNASRPDLLVEHSYRKNRAQRRRLD